MVQIRLHPCAARAASAAAAAPWRPCRRMALILLAWTCMCYVAFKLGNLDSHAKVITSEDHPGIHQRELLQNIVETRRPNPTSESASYSDEIIGPSAISNAQGITEEVNVLEVEPAVDQSPQKTEMEVVKELQGQLPNLPLVYLHENKNKNWHLRKENNKTCASFPKMYNLHISNLYWQETETSDGTFYLYGAYLDKRKENRLGPTIRILGMINRIEPKVKTFCQIWFSGQKAPVISKVLEYKYIWFKKWGNYKNGINQPYLLACQLPSTHWNLTPMSVSVVEHECDTATNNLRVIYNVLQPGEKKKKFGVCVKGLDFPDYDMSVRLSEWIETLSALGAEKVFLYKLDVHPNVTKVLEYYHDVGKVSLTPLTLPGYMPNMRGLQHLYLKNMLNFKRQNEIIPYNDCLYRNMYRYEYLALLDIDEVIMPKKAKNWKDMMEQEVIPASFKVKNVTRASYNFRNVYFMDSMLKEPFKDIPQYMHMMQHVYRSVKYTNPGAHVKCFHDTEQVLVLHNHFPLGCIDGKCSSYSVDIDVGQLQHYRAKCVNELKRVCGKLFIENIVLDAAIWRYKEKVVASTVNTLKDLDFFI